MYRLLFWEHHTSGMGAAASSRRRFEQLLFSPLSPPFLLHTSSSSTPDVDTRFRLFYSSPLFLHLFFKLLSLATAFLPIRSMPLLNKPSLRSFPEIGILTLVDPSLVLAGSTYLPIVSRYLRPCPPSTIAEFSLLQSSFRFTSTIIPTICFQILIHSLPPSDVPPYLPTSSKTRT